MRNLFEQRNFCYFITVLQHLDFRLAFSSVSFRLLLFSVLNRTARKTPSLASFLRAPDVIYTIPRLFLSVLSVCLLLLRNSDSWLSNVTRGRAR